MTDRNKLYEAVQALREERRRENFNVFLDSFEGGIVKDLDRYFVEDQSQYTDMVNRLKAQGFRVFRNSQGKHKIDFAI